LLKLVDAHRFQALGKAEIELNGLVRPADASVQNQFARAKANVVAVLRRAHHPDDGIDRLAAFSERVADGLRTISKRRMPDLEATYCVGIGHLFNPFAGSQYGTLCSIW